MSRYQEESVIKNIFRQIAQECAVKDHAVSETLVACMVKAVVLDARNEFNVDRTLTKQDVQKLVELCVEKLMDQSSPALDTIKMQVYFDMNYTSRREFLEEHHRMLQDRLSPVMREITDGRAMNQQELGDLYRKVIGYVLQRSDMGPPIDINIAREATAALHSVFPVSELAAFMVLMKKDKEQQLTQLTMIVTGICLFNKFNDKGGEAITNLPAILNEDLPATNNAIEYQLNQSQSQAWKYTALLERLMSAERQPMQCDVPLDLLKQALCNVRQHEAFLKIILADISLSAKQVEVLLTDLKSRMGLLNETVLSKTQEGLPTATVFPHFTALAKCWSGLQDERMLLNILHNVEVSLQPFLAAQSQMFCEGQLDGLLEGLEVKNDEQRIQESSSGNCIDPFEFKTNQWLLPETTANFDKLPLQYSGFCGYTFATKDGLLLPGNSSIGVLKHREKCYVFSSIEAALDFASKADEFIARVAVTATRSAELIALLELHQQFACVTPYSQMQSGERLPVKPITKCDGCTQTDTHLVESNIVTSYEWNEWELRRKAIKLANLRTKVTHSMQTTLSHMRRDNSTQVYLPKDAACQSMRDGQTNVPKPRVYLAGLRGLKTGEIIKTNLTRSIDDE